MISQSDRSTFHIIQSYGNYSVRPIRSFVCLQARAGLASSIDVLKVAEGYVNENNYTVWSDLSLNLSCIANMMQYTEATDAYKEYAKALFGPVAKRLGWEAEENEGNEGKKLKTP